MSGPRRREGIESVYRTVARVHPRRRVDDAFDRVRFSVDSFPRRGPLQWVAGTAYQPLPWLGIEEGRRAGGSVSRWQAVERYLDESAPGVGTAIDIGSNNGYFVLKLAERGLVSVGIESFPPFVRIATYAMKRAHVGETGMDALDVNPRSVSPVPPADVVVFLSVWHHMLREHGLEPATRILRTIWERTQHRLPAWLRAGRSG